MKSGAVVAITAAATAIVVGSIAIAAQANAATVLSERAFTKGSADCVASIQELVTYPLEDRYRVAISCTHVPDTLKMRGVAAFRLQPDQHTEWFTETGRTFYSQLATPLLGLTPEAKVETAKR